MQELLVRTYQRIPLVDSREMGSRSIIRERLKEIVGSSPTTPSFKVMVQEIIEEVCIEGRDSEPVETNLDAKFREVVQMESPTGIFSREGAIKGEIALYEFMSNEFLEFFKLALEEGLDPFDITKVSPPGFFSGDTEEFRNLMLNWHKEFKDRYGTNPIVIPSD